MFVRLMQAAAITLALYGLLCLNVLRTTTTAENSDTTEAAIESTEPTEVLIALKQALIRRQ